MTDAAAPPATGVRRMAKDSVAYAAGGLAGKLVGLLLLPVLTRFLDTTQFGQLDVLSTLVSVLISGLLLGLDTAALRLYFDQPDRSSARSLVGSWAALMAAIVVPVALVLGLLASPFSDALFGDNAQAIGVALVGVTLVGGSFHFLALTVLRMQRRPGTYATLTGGNLVLNGLFVVVAVTTGHRSVTAIMAALAASWSIAAVFGLVLVGRECGRPRATGARSLLRAGLPLAPGMAALWAAEFAHRAILLNRSDATQVAYFSVAVRFGSVGVLAATGIQLAWQPHTFARGNTPAGRDALTSEARQFVAGMCLLTGAIGLVAPEAVRIVGGNSYAGATAAAGWSVVFGLLLGVFYVASMPSTLATRLGEVGSANVVGVAVAVALGFAASATFGAAGTAAALAVGEVTAVAVVATRGRRHAHLEWPRLCALTGVTAVAVLGATVPGPEGTSVAVRAVLAAALVAVIVADGSVRGLLAQWRRGRSQPPAPSSLAR